MSYWLVEVLGNTPSSFVLLVPSDKEWVAESILNKAYPKASYRLEKLADL